ncbi:MAG TPA: preprotein translocase subunit SecE [Pseudonocardiaceae bacterium]|nr:preprotein translocase subunit SecE [Pseudonocardiaceae bacterium]
MADDHEQQDGAEGQEHEQAARPTTAAARREARASRAGTTGPAAAKAEARPKAATSRTSRRAKPSDEEVESGKATPSKAEQGITTRKRDAPDRSPSIIARFIKFLREVVSELRKVIWPTRKQQVTYTVVVLVFVAFVVAFVSGLDYGFTKLVFLVFS